MWTKSIGLILVPLFLAGCGGSGSGNQGPSHQYKKRELVVGKTYAGHYPIKVTCTIGMIADLVRNIGGKHVDVEVIIGGDVDPHSFTADTGHIHKLSSADLVFYNGLHLEGKMSDLLENLSKERLVFPVCEYLENHAVLHDEKLEFDPHVWFDVSLWSQAGGVVRDVLAAFDPSHAEEYKTRAQEYQGKLAKLHEYARERIASIPKSQRVMITAHDAFQYFSRAYDIEVKSIRGISTESQASVRHINELVDFIVKNKIKALFVETSVNPREMRALQEGCQARNYQIAEGGELHSDAMGERDYEGMIRHNVETIVKALR